MPEEKRFSYQRGRPTEKTPEIIAKLEEAAAFGASIEEIAFYAGIHRATLYRWLSEDQDLRDRITELTEKPILLARQTVINNLKNDPNMAFKYLERKKKDEFAEKKIIENQKTLEDLLDESENYDTNQQTTDRIVDVHSEQTGYTSAVQTEQGAELLLGTQDTP